MTLTYPGGSECDEAKVEGFTCPCPGGGVLKKERDSVSADRQDSN